MLKLMKCSFPFMGERRGGERWGGERWGGERRGVNAITLPSNIAKQHCQAKAIMLYNIIHTYMLPIS